MPSTKKSPVIEKLEQVSRMLNQAGNPERFTGVQIAVQLACARIKSLEERHDQTETLRDRIALQLLPGILQRHAEVDYGNDQEAIRIAYSLADQTLEIRAEAASRG